MCGVSALRLGWLATCGVPDPSGSGLAIRSSSRSSIRALVDVLERRAPGTVVVVVLPLVGSSSHGPWSWSRAVWCVVVTGRGSVVVVGLVVGDVVVVAPTDARHPREHAPS